MDSTFPEQIIQKEELNSIFQKLSFRVLSTNYSVKELFDTGERDVQRFVTEGFFRESLSADMKMLEIGCGVGRLSRSFSYNFKEVHAVDIAKEMVELAQALYVFSYYIFQHIRDMDEIIKTYPKTYVKQCF